MNPLQEPMLRLETATALRRFWHLERALTLAFGAWVPSVRRLETKAALARAAWESSLTAQAERARVFELRYPDRALEREPDASLVGLYEMIVNAPDGRSFLSAAAETFLPALRAAYAGYLTLSDPVADGPTHRFLRLALEEKTQQCSTLRAAAEHEAGSDTGGLWVRAMAQRLGDVGGVALGTAPPTQGRQADPGIPYRIPDTPERDERYITGRFYWPDNFDPTYPYGEGVQLQLRTAISHLNEVWAVESAGAILFELGPELGWDFIVDAARWLYDESRHMSMGSLRLEAWGFERSELPLGSFIYDSCAGKGPVYRLGMLSFFETKNIGRKAQRAVSFGALGDRSSQRDMEFDWADEAIHAGYGRRWLREAMRFDDRPSDEWPQLLRRCEGLVEAYVAEASEEDRAAIRQQAAKLVDKAQRTSLATARAT